MTTIIDGQTVTDLMGQTMTYSGSITMTPEEFGVNGNMHFTDNGLAITFDDTSTYTYLNDVVTINTDKLEFSAGAGTFASVDDATALAIALG